MRQAAELDERLREAVEGERWQEALEALEAQAAALQSDPQAASVWEEVRPLWEWARRQALAARTAAAAELDRLALARRYAGDTTNRDGGWELRG